MRANGKLPIPAVQDKFISDAQTWQANPQAVEYVLNGGVRASD